MRGGAFPFWVRVCGLDGWQWWWRWCCGRVGTRAGLRNRRLNLERCCRGRRVVVVVVVWGGRGRARDGEHHHEHHGRHERDVSPLGFGVGRARGWSHSSRPSFLEERCRRTTHRRCSALLLVLADFASVSPAGFAAVFFDAVRTSYRATSSANAHAKPVACDADHPPTGVASVSPRFLVRFSRGLHHPVLVPPAYNSLTNGY